MLFDQMLGPAPSAPVPEPLMTKAELAQHFGNCTRTIDRWVASDMPFVWTGKRQKRFRLSQVQLWLQENHIDRFAAQGIATTMTEVRRRIVNIPILNGLQIVEASSGEQQPSRPRGEERRAGQASKTSGSSFSPGCRPGRKPKNPSPGKSCRGNGHRWKTSRYTRTCAVCGLTQDRDPSDNWIEST